MELHVLSFLLLCLRPLQNHLHGLVVVSLDLEVCYPAVALRCGNLAMSQKVLNGSKVGIGIEKLRGHGVAKPMTRDVQPALSRIVFDPLLDTSHRYAVCLSSVPSAPETILSLSMIGFARYAKRAEQASSLM